MSDSCSVARTPCPRIAAPCFHNRASSDGVLQIAAASGT